MNQQTQTHKPVMKNFQKVPHVVLRESIEVLSRFVKTRIFVLLLEKVNT